MTPSNGTNGMQPAHPLFDSLDSTGGRGLSGRSVTIAVLLNVALVLIAFELRTRLAPPPVHRFADMMAPLIAPAFRPKLDLGSGGGGRPGVAPASLGTPPKLDSVAIHPPLAPPLEAPKISIDESVIAPPEVIITSNPMPNLGLTSAPVVTASLGNSRGPGAGIGSGPGPGIGGNGPSGVGVGNRRGSGRMSPPIVLYSPEPEYSEAARKSKLSGNVIVALLVDEQGRPTRVRILRGIGSGLDEKAIAAVSQYRFKPAMDNGRAVAVEMNVDVYFQIF